MNAEEQRLLDQDKSYFGEAFQRTNLIPVVKGTGNHLFLNVLVLVGGME